MSLLALDKSFVLDNFNIVLDIKYIVQTDGRGKSVFHVLLTIVRDNSLSLSTVLNYEFIRNGVNFNWSCFLPFEQVISEHSKIHNLRVLIFLSKKEKEKSIQIFQTFLT